MEDNIDYYFESHPLINIIYYSKILYFILYFFTKNVILHLQ